MFGLNQKAPQRERRRRISGARAARSDLRILFVVLLGTIPHISACSKCSGDKIDATSEPAPPSEFIWSGVDPASLDPAFIQDMAAWWISVNLFEGLATFPPDNGPVRPGVAYLPPEVSDDGLTWTFKLRPEARWSDGKPVISDDFVYAWRRQVDPATGSKNADDFRPLVGASEIASGAETNLTTLGVDAPEPHSLVIRLRHPVPTLLTRLATPPFFPVPKETIAKHGDQWTRPENLVGNGPYLLKEHVPRERMVFQKNAAYWDAGSVALERSTMVHVESEDLAWKLYHDDRLHWLQTIPAERVMGLVSDRHPELVLAPMLCSAGVQINTRKPPFDNPKVREALAKATDREKLVRQVLRRPDEPTASFIPHFLREVIGYEGASGSEFDPEGARLALAEAGYPQGAGFPKATYIFNTYSANKTVAEFLQSNWEEVLGIRISLENLEFRSWVARVRAGDFELSRHSLCGQPDPGQWIDVFRTGGDSNTVGLSDPQIDSLIEQINSTPTVHAQLQLAKQGEERILKSFAIIPLYSPVRPYLVKPFVRGFSAQASDIHPLKYIRLER